MENSLDHHGHFPNIYDLLSSYIRLLPENKGLPLWYLKENTHKMNP